MRPATPTRTGQIARHDKITIDGVDVSNSFRTFGRPSTDSQEDVSGFSTTGTDEFLPGSRNQQFTGEAFYTEELARLIEPLYTEPHGRRDHLAAGRPRRLDPRGLRRHLHDHRVRPDNTRGSASTFPFTAVPDVNGIHVSDWT
jgi:hypothetical protein